MKVFYIAHNCDEQGIDEVQRTLILAQVEENLAFEGPVGLGKTQLAFFLGEILGKEVLDSTCSNDMTESPLIGFPVMTSNGGTQTEYQNGILTKAMEQGDIFYGDELNQLRPEIQKRLNSAFDDRKSLRRRDGKLIQAKDGFLGIISFNPDTAPRNRPDINDSLADRFAHLNFPYFPAELEAKIVLVRAGIIELESLVKEEDYEQRGIYQKDDFLKFARWDNQKRWVDFFSSEEIDQEIHPYFVYKSGGVQISANTLSQKEQDKVLVDYSLKLSGYAKTVRNFIQSSLVGLESHLASQLGTIAGLSSIDMHTPTPRTSARALRLAKIMLSAYRVDVKTALSFATSQFIEDVAFGQFRDELLREGLTKNQAVRILAESEGLLVKGEYRIDFD